MKKYVLKSSLFSGLAALLLLFPNIKESKLEDITKPYLGQYECEEATLGEMDFTDEFSYIRLELKADETFILYCCPKDGKVRKETGKYTYDKEEGALWLSAGANGELRRKFPLQKGELLITLPVGKKILTMKFTQK